MLVPRPAAALPQVAPLNAAADLLARASHGLVAALGPSRGRVSSHLMCLCWCGFVTARQAGKREHNRVGDPRVADMVRLAHGLLLANAQAIAACAAIEREA